MKLLGLSLGLLSAATLGVPMSEPPSFDGEWELNREESDDAQAKMKALRETMREQMAGSGGRGGMGGGQRNGQRRSGRSGGPGEMMGGPAQQPRILELELVDSEFHVVPGDSKEPVAIFYLDGETHHRETRQGQKVETLAELRGDAIHIEEVMERGRVKIETTRRYELSPSGDRLVVTVQMKLPRSKEPLLIRSVYDAAQFP